MTAVDTTKNRQFYIGFAKRYQVLVDPEDTSGSRVFYVETLSVDILVEIRRFLAKKLCLQQIDQESFNQFLVKAYETASSEAMQMAENMEDELDLYRAAEELSKTQDLLESQDDAPIIRLINAILSEALKETASDIHIETFEESLSVRFRVDGVLRKVLEPQRLLAPLLVSRIKVMAKLDIAEKRLPQDGRMALHIGGKALDVRVSTMPASHGERVVLRLLEKSGQRLDLATLGLSLSDLQTIKSLIHKPHGILLATGPTGSGKTTTLYSALTVLNQATRNILTVEDPVEYNLDGIGQTQVNTKVNMTFAKGLRAILRQDPDVVMIGEIRDLETAEIAVQASLTGHLVLSTLHTNTAVGAVTRLRDMGIENFLLSTSLIGVLAQRLVRLLCPKCKKAKIATAVEARMLAKEPSETIKIYEATGCEACNQIGFSGRVGIYELLIIDDVLRELVSKGASEMEMERQARKHHHSIRTDGIKRVLAGETTLQEIMRVTAEDF